MADLTYIPPAPPARPFAKGDAVEVLDRTGNVIGHQVVIRASEKTVRTDCGRSWTQRGKWIGTAGVWPFPSIRLTN